VVSGSEKKRTEPGQGDSLTRDRNHLPKKTLKQGMSQQDGYEKDQKIFQKEGKNGTKIERNAFSLEENFQTPREGLEKKKIKNTLQESGETKWGIGGM